MKFYYYLITPFLGCLRNYVKYKQVSLSLFLRTPLTYFIFHSFYCLLGVRSIIWKTLISERWFFFIYKTYLSIYNDDYHKKKEKYKIKYNINYGDE
tara:strand:+ start:107 stop:394 length:288 start_codon:yes stop_codon:yes gene_type:complete